eukprot:scaffold38424_cov168-Amphora_coffeaeformis.AAC.7
MFCVLPGDYSTLQSPAVVMLWYRPTGGCGDRSNDKRSEPHHRARLQNCPLPITVPVVNRLMLSFGWASYICWYHVAAAADEWWGNMSHIESSSSRTMAWWGKKECWKRVTWRKARNETPTLPTNFGAYYRKPQSCCRVGCLL